MAAAVAHHPAHMHHGSGMDAPGFASRRPNASNLPNFELPPPPLASSQKYQYAISGNSGNHTPGSLASVGNLLTPPSTVAGDVSPSPTGHGNTSSAPSQSYSHGYTSWSPSQQTYYTTQAQQPQQHSYRSPYAQQSMLRGHPHSPNPSDGSSMPQYDGLPYSGSAPLTPATVPSMASQQNHQQSHQHLQPHMMGSSTPVSTGSQPSPVHAQDQFRPPPTPTFYPQQNTPQQSAFPFSTGPSQPQMTLSSTGPMQGRPQMSPVTSGPLSGLPSPAIHSPHAMQGRFPPYGPVMSNMHNPNGQAIMVTGMPHAMVSFNSGHAAGLAGLYGVPAPQPSPQTERPFKCDQCPQSFNRNHDLKRHKRIHLAVKPFPCGHCDKSFSRKDALKRHVLVKGCGEKEKAKQEAAKQEALSASSSSSSPLTKSTTSESTVDSKIVLSK